MLEFRLFTSDEHQVISQLADILKLELKEQTLNVILWCASHPLHRLPEQLVGNLFGNYCIELIFSLLVQLR